MKSNIDIPNYSDEEEEIETYSSPKMEYEMDKWEKNMASLQDESSKVSLDEPSKFEGSEREIKFKKRRIYKPEELDRKYDARFLQFRSPPDIIVQTDVEVETLEGGHRKITKVTKEIIGIHKETMCNSCLTLRKIFYGTEMLSTNFQIPTNEKGQLILKTDFQPDLIEFFFNQVYKLPHRFDHEDLSDNQLIVLYEIASYYDCYLIQTEVINQLEKRFCEISTHKDIPLYVVALYGRLKLFLLEETSATRLLSQLLDKIVNEYRTKWFIKSNNSIAFFIELPLTSILEIARSSATSNSIDVTDHLVSHYIESNWSMIDSKFIFEVLPSNFFMSINMESRQFYTTKIKKKLLEEGNSNDSICDFYNRFINILPKKYTKSPATDFPKTPVKFNLGMPGHLTDKY